MMRATLGVLMSCALVACADNDRAGEQAPPDTEVRADAQAPAESAAAVNSSGLLDPNTASAEQLASVPGLTSELAQQIVDHRPFADMRAVDQVLSSLSEARRDTVYTRLWKPLDLNSASAEEIELIPGVGPRMRHEFEEYRPYTSMEQFRREIGKYVDDEEVARLEQYVTIRPAGA